MFGWIKGTLGFGRFSLRGLKKVRAEWTLVCLAFNVSRLHLLKQRQKQQASLAFG